MALPDAVPGWRLAPLLPRQGIGEGAHTAAEAADTGPASDTADVACTQGQQWQVEMQQGLEQQLQPLGSEQPSLFLFPRRSADASGTAGCSGQALEDSAALAVATLLPAAVATYCPVPAIATSVSSPSPHHGGGAGAVHSATTTTCAAAAAAATPLAHLTTGSAPTSAASLPPPLPTILPPCFAGISAAAGKADACVANQHTVSSSAFLPRPLPPQVHPARAYAQGGLHPPGPPLLTDTSGSVTLWAVQGGSGAPSAGCESLSHAAVAAEAAALCSSSTGSVLPPAQLGKATSMWQQEGVAGRFERASQHVIRQEGQWKFWRDIQGDKRD